MVGPYVRPLVHGPTIPLSSPPCIQWHVYGGEGGRMAVTVQIQFESAVPEMYQDACVGSSLENGATMIKFALRQRDFQPEVGVPSTLYGRKEASHVNVHELVPVQLVKTSFLR